MIGLPFNDHACLGAITETMADLVENRDPALVELAGRFATTDELAAWLRSLPQRDDVGDPADGPHVDACEPPQRLRVAPPNPNCIERSSTFIAVAELIDPGPVRQLATIDTPDGKHTFPVENGAPIILDPRVTRNALEGGLFRMQPGPVRLTPRQTIDWLTSLAAEPAGKYRNGRRRVRRARRALRGLLAGRPLKLRNAGDVGFTLALADREARLFGRRGMRVAETTTRALSQLDAAANHRNAPELRMGGYSIRPHAGTLAALGRVGGRLGVRVGTAALRLKLASWGIDDMLLREIERELNVEGLTLGELAKPPPMPGSLAAVTADALAGRWVASRTG
jgi:hypothetical protein